MPMSGWLPDCDSEHVDLLDMLLRDPSADARTRLSVALDEGTRHIEELAFNAFEVTIDHESGEVRVYDVLDGEAPPTVVSLDDLRRRLR